MHKVVVERELKVPVHKAWEILDDFGGVYRYHPMVEKSPIDNGIDAGLGAERISHFDNGDRIKERITGYEAGQEYTVEIVDPGRFPLQAAHARLSLRSVNEDRSRVRFEMSFQPKYGPLGWLMGATVMQTRFRKALAEILAGLETHARTGKLVDRELGLAMAA